MEALENINNPKVSVIIPVYNVRKYLAESLDSIINQTYKNLEIIIINDGSDDGSEIICEEYAKKDPRIKLIHRENGGLSAARNTGLDNMTGKYVAFLDSDDAFIPETIEKSLNSMILHNVDCVAFQNLICKTKKDNRLNRLRGKINDLYMPQGIYSRKEALNLVANHYISVTAWSKLSKSEIWDNLRFPEGQVYEDLYIIFKMMSKIKKMYLMNEPLVLYRIRPGSINFDHSVKNTRDLLDSWSVFENFVEKNTPELFEPGQIIKTDEKILNYLVTKCAGILPLHFQYKTEVLNLMKEKIKQLGKNVQIENCSAKIRLLHYLIFNHPILLSIFFLPCRTIYRAIKGGVLII